MCGVFGFVSNGEAVDFKRLRKIAIDTESRGAHAHGIAWIDGEGRLRRYKSPGRISKNLGCLELAKDARMIIGHCRYATHGAYEQNENNHPHPADGGWIVHNGIVHNYAHLARLYDLPVVSECDSEVLGLLLEVHDGSLLERSRTMVREATGGMVVLGLWARPARMLIARRGRPLHVMRDVNHNVYLASLPNALENPERLRENTVRVVRAREGKLCQRILEVEPCRESQRENDPPLGRDSRRYSFAAKDAQQRWWASE